MKAPRMRSGVLMVLVLLTGCGEVPPPPPLGYVTGAVPPEVRTGSHVTVRGHQLGYQGTVFGGGGRQLETSAWSDSAITVKIPADAPSGPFTLVVHGAAGSLGTATVRVLPPSPLIRSVTPEIGMVGATITVTGAYLGDRGKGRLIVHGAEVTEIKEWTPARIVAVVPPLPAQPGMHAVWLEGEGGPSNQKEFAIVRPYASHTVPEVALADRPITIHGRDFGTTKGRVLIGPKRAEMAIAEWNDRSIRARVPAGEGGELEVRVVNPNGISIPMIMNVLPQPTLGRIPGAKGDQVALALDAIDLPRILVFNSKTNALGLTSWTMNGWNTAHLLVQLGQSKGTLPVAAPDLEDKIQAIMRKHAKAAGDQAAIDAAIDKEVQAAVAEAQRLAPSQAISAMAAGQNPQLMIDGSQRMHVTMYESFKQKIVYGTRAPEGGDWEFRYVEPEPAATNGIFSSIAVDARGAVHVAFTDAKTRQVKHAVSRDGRFVSEVADPEQGVGVAVSLALSPDGKPALAYLDHNQFDLKVSVSDGKSFRVDRVDAEGWTGDMPSLVLGDDGEPVVAYMARSADGTAPAGVKLATRTRSGWKTEWIEKGHGAGNQPLLRRDRQGRYHLAFWDVNDSSVHYLVRKDASSPWDAQSRPIAEMLHDIQPSLMAMAIASDGTARVAYWTAAGHLEYWQLVPR